MKNRVYFSTGTGSNLEVEKNISESLNDCELIAIYMDTSLELLPGYKRIGFVFPNYAGGPPKMVADFIRNMKFPQQGDTYLFAIATYGGNAGSVIAQTGEMFKQKSWVLNYGDTIWSYPNLVTSYPMIKGVGSFTKMSNRTSKRLSKKIVAQHSKSIPIIKESAQKRYESYMAQFPDIDRAFHVNDNCISCEVCRKICPAKNITMNDGKPMFHHRCESCMACIQYCPKQAINYKDKTQKRGRYTHPNVNAQEIIQLRKELF